MQFLRQDFSLDAMKKDSESLDKAFDAFCKRAGFRRTLQRKIVYELFYGACAHLSVEEIMEKISRKCPELREESVYRILGDFVEAGFIRKVKVPGVARYEYASAPHGHFVCERCGKIFDVDISGINMPESLSGASDISLTFSGLCPACSRRRAGQKPR